MFTCYYSACDNIVFPASTAVLPGARHVLLEAVAHVDMAFLPALMDAVLALPEGGCQPPPTPKSNASNERGVVPAWHDHEPGVYAVSSS